MGQAFCQIYDGDQYHLEATELEGVGDERASKACGTLSGYTLKRFCVLCVLYFYGTKNSRILLVSKSSKEKLIPDLIWKLEGLAALGKHSLRMYLRTHGLHNRHRMNVNLPGSRRVELVRFVLSKNERMFNHSQPICCQLPSCPSGRDPVQGFAFSCLFSMHPNNVALSSSNL